MCPKAIKKPSINSSKVILSDKSLVTYLCKNQIEVRKLSKKHHFPHLYLMF